MSSKLASHLAGPTHVSHPIPMRADMVPNADGGGFAFVLDQWEQLRRFLILGTGGGTYYAGEREITVANATMVAGCIAADAVRTVALIHEVSVRGLAKKQEPTLLALALCFAAKPDTDQGAIARKEAARVLPAICRTGSMLLQFVGIVTSLRGWSKGLQHAVANWYEFKSHGDADTLAFQLVKYRQRDGWSHRDVMKLCHPKGIPATIANWLLGKPYATNELPAIIQAFEQLQKGTTSAGENNEDRPMTEREVAALVRLYKLPWEALPTDWHKSADVWAALVPNMPPHALVRNLGRLTTLGLIAPGGPLVAQVVAQLTAKDAMTKSRMHPFAVWVALKTYGQGHGIRSTWSPNPAIVEALGDLFTTALDAMPKTTKKYALVVDASHSMNHTVLDGLCSAAEAAAVMAYTLHRQAPDSLVFGFSSASWLVADASPRQRLDDYVRAVFRKRLAEETNLSCIVPTLESMPHFVPDALIAITDGEMNEGWHPVQAVQKYRGSRLMPTVVVATTATETTIADPTDPQWFNCVGCDASLAETVSMMIGGAA